LGPKKSAQLVDSILKGYPIGTFILWKTKESLRTVRNIGGAKLPDTPPGDFVQHVLDGQQRLTSLYASVKGLQVERDERIDDFSEMYVEDRSSLLQISLLDGAIASQGANRRMKSLQKCGMSKLCKSADSSLRLW
jgi:uncharacterized protein with ParB-like and HNH nuclease domain